MSNKAELLSSFVFIGSPAEKADLEVADEILEINGQSLENSTHTDVIAHIHNVRALDYNLQDISFRKRCWHMATIYL